MVLWVIYAHATALDMRPSVVYCDLSSKYCLGVKYLSKKLGDWGDDLSVDNFVYEKANKFDNWQKIAILNPLLRGPRDGHINIGNMKMHCNNYGVCLLASIIELKSGFLDIVTYVTSDGGLHWNGPEYLNLPQTKAVNILDLSCNQAGYECQILIQEGWFERPVIYKTEDLGKTWVINAFPNSYK